MNAVLYLLLFFVSCLTGCASQQHADGSEMEVSADVSEMHRCSRISPEIEVADAPAMTVTYDVILEDLVDPNRVHGGGMWPADESGTIPSGALTRFYMGPCPPGEDPRHYQYTVKALDAQGSVLAVRKYVFEQE